MPHLAMLRAPGFVFRDYSWRSLETLIGYLGLNPDAPDLWRNVLRLLVTSTGQYRRGEHPGASVVHSPTNGGNQLPNPSTFCREHTGLPTGPQIREIHSRSRVWLQPWIPSPAMPSPQEEVGWNRTGDMRSVHLPLTSGQVRGNPPSLTPSLTCRLTPADRDSQADLP